MHPNLNSHPSPHGPDSRRTARDSAIELGLRASAPPSVCLERTTTTMSSSDVARCTGATRIFGHTSAHTAV
jgi:hypothetical protein